MSRIQAFLIASSLIAGSAAQSFGQFKTSLVNSQGATAPCVGIGPIGGPLAKECVTMFEQAGFIRVDEVGITGLTLGTLDKEDGVITRVDPGSPAAHAGLAVGDSITAINNNPVKPTPGTIAAQLTFGQRGEELHMTVRRGGSDLDVHLVRAPRAVPGGPKSPSMFVSVKPLIDWRNQFIPCMGAGPAGFAAITYCDQHFKPFGFIKVGKMGSTGFHLDLDRTDKAIIASVDPGSPAAKADIRPGDEIVAVEGQPLTASVGGAATERLFGKPGDQLHITVHSGQADKTITLTLAAKSASS